MKKQILIISLLIICLIFSFGCSNFTTQDKAILQKSNLSNIDFIIDAQDKPEPIKDYSSFLVKTIKQLKEFSTENKNDIVGAVEETIEPPTEETVEQSTEENYYNYDYNNYSDYYNTDYIDINWDGDTSNSGLTQQSGVNYYNDRTETYYSSNVLYHQNTDQWTVDNEGFYRTDEGYYVVAASDMPQGTTFEGSKGTCIVLDSGCAEGVTDYYVSWN